MDTDELFIDGHKLPEPLSKEELYILIKEAKEGSKKAQDKLIVHNIRLVLYEVTSKFQNVNYEKKDLVSIGNIGLVKAINTYDPSKGYVFATYASRCIDNEILMFLRKLKKDQSVDSLDRIVFQNSDGSEIKLEDLISDDTDLVEDFGDEETHKIIREVIKELPDRDREIIMLYFGFYDNKIYTQREIADKFNISQSYVSRLIIKIIKNIENMLVSKGVIELHSKQQKVKGKENDEMPKLKTIYEYFNKYTREEIDEMLMKLTDEERALLTKRYGEDLDNPVSAKLTKEQTDKFYGTLVPKMKRLLSNPIGESKQRKPKQRKVPQSAVIEQAPVNSKAPISQPVIPEQTEGELLAKTEEPQEQPVIPKTPISQPVIPEQTEGEVVAKTKVQQEQPVQPTSTENVEMIKEDYIKILELLRAPIFKQMMGVLSVKEAVIISLKLGYIDGKYFSTESIAQFLGIEEAEVIETTKKVLLIYKDSINTLLENAIEVATSKQDKVISINQKKY